MINSTPTIVIFALYFGHLPPYFQLWLNSCENNFQIKWRLLTDADLAPYRVPENVEVTHTSLDAVVHRLRESLPTTINVDNPYKLCDLRPMYWALLQPSEKCDYWGHCDIDMIFGKISSFLTEEILSQNDKIFSVGHFTIYRNARHVNMYFTKSHPSLDYQDIFRDPNHRGFDEHEGVNKIWQLHGGRFFENEKLILDIDPSTKRFERTNTFHFVRNYRHQAFQYENGSIKRLYWKRGKLHSEEFMYIHFQKRKFDRWDVSESYSRFYIGPDGFFPAGNKLLSKADLDRINGRYELSTRNLVGSLRRLKRAVFRALHI